MRSHGRHARTVPALAAVLATAATLSAATLGAGSAARGPSADRLAARQATRGRLLSLAGLHSPPLLRDLADRAFTLDAVAAYTLWEFTQGAADGPRLLGAAVSGGFFEALGVEPALGRTLSAADDDPAAEPVTVVSLAFWRRHLGGDPDVIGRHLVLDTRPYRVVGVMPAGFGFPDAHAEVWTAVSLELPEAVHARGARFLRSFVRLKPGVMAAEAQEEMTAISRQLADEGVGQDGPALVLASPLPLAESHARLP